MLIKDIQPGAGSSDAGIVSNFATVQGKVYFSADDGLQGFELWESDGTPSGPRLVADVFPGGDEGYPNTSYPWGLTSSGGMLIDSADDGVHILKQNGVPTEYHVLKGIKHYDVYSGQCLDDVMKLEIPWFDKYLKGEK